MPRRARLSLPGIPWHIIQRGNNRSACFYADEDHRRYLDTLREMAGKYHCAIHAYVLMTNHVHLLLTPERPDSAGLLMKHLGQRYVQYVNRTYRRSGTLWEGRFRSCLTQSEDYVLTCYRTIELNPVRADMVQHPRDYRWSSYRANAEGATDPCLNPMTNTHDSADPHRNVTPLTGHFSLPISTHNTSRRSAPPPTATTLSATNASRTRSVACSASA